MKNNLALFTILVLVASFTIPSLDATEEYNYDICYDLLFLDQAILISTGRDDIKTFENFFRPDLNDDVGADSYCGVSFQLTSGPPVFVMEVQSYKAPIFATNDFNLQLDNTKDDIEFEENIVGPNSIKYHLVDDPQTKYVKFVVDINIITFQTPYDGQEPVVTVDDMVELAELTKIRFIEISDPEREPINLALSPCIQEFTVHELYIFTGKDNYERGDDIEVYGCVPDLYHKGVNIEILDPQGESFAVRSLVPELDGWFRVTIPIDEEFGEDGTYTAQAEYGNYIASQTFVVPEFGSLALIVLAITIVSVIIFSKKSTLFEFSK